MEIMPTSLPLFSTGRWRRRLLLMICMHCSLVWSGFTNITAEVITSLTCVTAEVRPISAILRA